MQCRTRRPSKRARSAAGERRERGCYARDGLLGRGSAVAKARMTLAACACGDESRRPVLQSFYLDGPCSHRPRVNDTMGPGVLPDVDATWCPRPERVADARACEAREAYASVRALP